MPRAQYESDDVAHKMAMVLHVPHVQSLGTDALLLVSEHQNVVCDEKSS